MTTYTTLSGQTLGHGGFDLFRTRHATATRVPLREEVVILRWPR